MGSLRVLQVTPRFWPSTGGVETHVWQVSRRLAKAGVDVTILTTNHTGDLEPEAMRDGVRVIRVPAWPAGGELGWAPAVARVIRQGGWDLVHLQSYHTLVAPLAMWAARSSRVPYVVTFHGGGHSSSWRHRMRGAQRLLLQPLLARADRLVALAAFERELFGARLGISADQFVLIPNGSDITHDTLTPKVAREPGLIVSVGRLERYKGHQHLLRAFPALLIRHPQTRLWIAGSGPYEHELRRLATDLGIQDRVDIHAIPASDRTEFQRELARASVVTLLSDFETQPIAVLEGLALGAQAVVAHNSGMAELVKRGWARGVAQPDNPQHLVAALHAALTMPLPAIAPQDLPSWDQCAGQLLTLYRAVRSR